MRIKEALDRLNGWQDSIFDVETEHSEKELKNLQMVSIAIIALSKQIPKPVEMSHCKCGMIVDDDMQYCHSCGHIVYRSNFCESCSQALDWGDEDE